MSRLQYVWDTGDCQDYQDWSNDTALETMAGIAQFKSKTGAQRVVRLRWLNEQKVVECSSSSAVLPDKSGVVVMDKWHEQGGLRTAAPASWPYLRVLNADGSLRCCIYPPVIDEKSLPAESWIELPRAYPERGIAFGAPACDGWRDIVVEFDWQTGKMLRWTLASWLRY